MGTVKSIYNKRGLNIKNSLIDREFEPTQVEFDKHEDRSQCHFDKQSCSWYWSPYSHHQGERI